MKRVSAEEVAKHLRYEPDTGFFYWLDRPWLRPSVNARTRFKKAGTKSDGYIRITITVDSVEIRMLGHRVAWALMNGCWSDLEIDHVDGDGFNNKWSNLREASSAQNKHNTSGWKKKDLPKGVFVDKRRNGFFSQIRANGVTTYLGSFKTVADARLAYVSASKQLHGCFYKV